MVVTVFEEHNEYIENNKEKDYSWLDFESKQEVYRLLEYILTWNTYLTSEIEIHNDFKQRLNDFSRKIWNPYLKEIKKYKEEEFNKTNKLNIISAIEESFEKINNILTNNKK